VKPPDSLHVRRASDVSNASTTPAYRPVFITSNRITLMSQLKKSQKTYQKPTLTVFGSVQQITAGGTRGSYLDVTFPRGTPLDELTLS
jgi:predicted metalloprotease